MYTSFNRLQRLCIRSHRGASLSWNQISHRSFGVDVRAMPLPSLSPTMTQGSIASWKKAPGDTLNAGDVLCEIETDKASVGLEIQDDGVLAKILVDAMGVELPVGAPIALIVDTIDEYNEFKKMDPSTYAHLIGGASSSSPPSTSSTPSPTISTSVDSNSKPKQLSPAARHFVDSKSLDIKNIQGSVKGGKIVTKGDILQGLQAGTIKSSPTNSKPATKVASSTSASSPVSHSKPISSPVPSNAIISSEPVNQCYVDIPNSNMRKVIAKRLTESKSTVPHLYVSMDVNIDKVLSLRKELKKSFDINVSVNDLVIKSVAMALRDVPEAYAKWNPKTQSVDRGSDIDISVAVATPSGLITPIVTHADKRGLADINASIKDLATRARDGKLKPEEYQGGAFSVSNLGMYGISSFSAVINPPQACILAVGAGIQRIAPPSPSDKASTPDSKPKLRTVNIVTVQLSADRRVVDEAIASQFLQVFREYLSDPIKLLL